MTNSAMRAKLAPWFWPVAYALCRPLQWIGRDRLAERVLDWLVIAATRYERD